MDVVRQKETNQWRKDIALLGEDDIAIIYIVFISTNAPHARECNKEKALLLLIVTIRFEIKDFLKSATSCHIMKNTSSKLLQGWWFH